MSCSKHRVHHVYISRPKGNAGRDALDEVDQEIADRRSGRVPVYGPDTLTQSVRDSLENYRTIDTFTSDEKRAWLRKVYSQ